MEENLLSFFRARHGHFRLESGQHGDLWFDLETLCLHPRGVQTFAAQLAAKLSQHKTEVVCGPLVEGAYIALLVALELGCEFIYAERFANTAREGLYPVEYRLPKALQSAVQGKRVAIVNDVISAGSAVRGTFSDLPRHRRSHHCHRSASSARRFHRRIRRGTLCCSRTFAANAAQLVDALAMSPVRRRQAARDRGHSVERWAIRQAWQFRGRSGTVSRVSRHDASIRKGSAVEFARVRTS